MLAQAQAASVQGRLAFGPQRGQRLCRYAARPAVATKRLHELPDGRIAYDLRHSWSNGTTRVVFEPLTFLEKLAALVPPPRAHQVTYHGVLAPAAAWRASIVPGPSTSRRKRPCVDGAAGVAPRRRYSWAELLRRVLPLTCCAAGSAVGGVG